MKNPIFTLLVISILSLVQACGDPPSPPPPPPPPEPPMTTKAPSQAASPTSTVKEEKAIDPVLGYYTGAFDAAVYDNNKRPSYSNKITISLEKIEHDQVEGYSIVAGNQRPFSGKYVQSERGYTIEAKEPGDDRYDGVFYFTVNPETRTLKGSWKSNSKKLAVTERSYDLKKQRFKYNPNLMLPEDVAWSQLYDANQSFDEESEGEFLTEDVSKLNPSNTLLRKEDIENMYQGDLEVIRNSIYARHGYSFKNRKMRYIFDSSVEWYMPVSLDIRDQLTEIEQKNIDLIKRYEEHADKYYDVFGR